MEPLIISASARHSQNSGVNYSTTKPNQVSAQDLPKTEAPPKTGESNFITRFVQQAEHTLNQLTAYGQCPSGTSESNLACERKRFALHVYWKEVAPKLNGRTLEQYVKDLEAAKQAFQPLSVPQFEELARNDSKAFNAYNQRAQQHHQIETELQAIRWLQTNLEEAPAKPQELVASKEQAPVKKHQQPLRFSMENAVKSD